MRKTIIICSYVLAIFSVLFGGLLIAGSCQYSSSAGPMNIDLSSILSLFGLFILTISMFRFKEQFKTYNKISATVMIIYAVGLFVLGQYSINHSKKFYDELNTMADVFPPNSGCLAIYYLTSFIAFTFGLILFADKFDKSNKQIRY